MELASATSAMASVRRDFVEWHRGRSPYVFWAIDVDGEALRQALSRAGRHLSGLLIDDYRRQPHVTLDLCGFPAAMPRAEDEFSAAWLAQRIRQLRDTRPGGFAIDIGGLRSFRSAPYFAVSGADEALAAVRACLAEKGANRLFGDYVPHCTVGLYAAAWPAAPLVERLRSFAGEGVQRFAVRRISLMSYQPSEIAGPLTLLADYWLASGEMEWHPAGAGLGFERLPA